MRTVLLATNVGKEPVKTGERLAAAGGGRSTKKVAFIFLIVDSLRILLTDILRSDCTLL